MGTKKVGLQEFALGAAMPTLSSVSPQGLPKTSPSKGREGMTLEVVVA